MSFVIVHCIVSICCSIQSAAIEHLGPICKQHGIELSMGQMISKGIFDIVTLSTIVHKIDPAKKSPNQETGLGNRGRVYSQFLGWDFFCRF